MSPTKLSKRLLFGAENRPGVIQMPGFLLARFPESADAPRTVHAELRGREAETEAFRVPVCHNQTGPPVRMCYVDAHGRSFQLSAAIAARYTALEEYSNGEYL